MKRPVCIIDDDEDVRSVMCFALEYEDIQTISFESAQKAEEYLLTLDEASLPCLILVDYMMPDMDGVDFIQRALQKYPDTIGALPLALSTARISEETLALPPGVSLLPKPIDLVDLIAIAKKHYYVTRDACSSF